MSWLNIMVRFRVDDGIFILAVRTADNVLQKRNRYK
nr:MAG TPA: YhdB-like protein [Caudoviricetes sp.]